MPEQRFDDPGDLEPEPEPIEMDFGAGELKNLPDPPFKQEMDDNEEDEDDDEDSEEFERVADRPERMLAVYFILNDCNFNICFSVAETVTLANYDFNWPTRID